MATIISTFNGEKYIEEQLVSIVNQTKKINKIYIFDDCSKDRTVEIVKRVLSHVDIQIEIIENKRNKGWKLNYIDALKYVREDIIFLADQDDIWMPNKVEVMSGIMEKYTEINVLTSNYELLFSEDSTTEKIAEERRLSKDGKLMKVVQKDTNFYVRQPGCSFCVRKTFFDKYFEGWNDYMPHDAFLWKTALLTGTLYSINRPLFKWRRHSSNESNRKKITREDRIREVKSDYIYINHMRNTIDNNYFLSKAYSFNNLRNEMFKKNSVIYWIRLFWQYRKFYVSFRSCMGDLYFLLKE